jgi:D-sedoheptulose 7-phosphate isomerase
MTTDSIRSIFDASARLKLACAETMAPQLSAVADAMVAALKAGKKICWMGNGGSAADAQHMAAELVCRFYKDRQALPSMSFHENASSVTAIANDYAYDHIYARQAEAFVQPGDVVVGISTSGRSKNVILGLQASREKGAVTVAMTGSETSAIADCVDHCLAVPSTDTPRIQECHTTIGHILCEIVENAFVQP